MKEMTDSELINECKKYPLNKLAAELISRFEKLIATPKMLTENDMVHLLKILAKEQHLSYKNMPEAIVRNYLDSKMPNEQQETHREISCDKMISKTEPLQYAPMQTCPVCGGCGKIF